MTATSAQDGTKTTPVYRAIAEPVTRHAIRGPDTLEARIGARWLLYIGVAVLILGVGFFVKYAFDNAWVTETLRVLIGVGVGAVMLYAGRRSILAGYVRYGQIVAGGGFAVLYLTVYAAFNFYRLIGTGPAFGLLFGLSLAAGVVADRLSASGLALMWVGGGFITPLMIGGRTDRQATLFSYDALLVALTMVLARRRSWPQLNFTSFILTGLTVASWMIQFYTPAKYLRTELFLTLFCGMFLYILRENRRSRHPLAPLVTAALAMGPVGYHLVSVGLLFNHSIALLVYLIGFSLAGVVLAVTSGHELVRLLVWGAVLLPFYAWLTRHSAAPWIAPALATLLAVYGMHLLVHVELTLRRAHVMTRSGVLLVHLNGLGLFAGTYQIVERLFPDFTGALAAALAVWNAGLAWMFRRKGAGSWPHALAVAFALAAAAVALQFNGAWVTIGWAAEGAAVMWVGLRTRREWVRLGGALLLAFAVVRLFDNRFFETPAGFVAVFNPRVGAGGFIVVLLFGLARLHVPRGEGAPLARPRLAAVYIVAANVLALMILSAEINSFWRVRDEQASADLARSMSLSIGWTIYAMVLIFAGIWRRCAPIRYLAIALLAVTVIKVFTMDLSELSGIYRISGFVVLGLVLLAASFLYERYRSRLSAMEEQSGQA